MINNNVEIKNKVKPAVFTAKLNTNVKNEPTVEGSDAFVKTNSIEPPDVKPSQYSWWGYLNLTQEQIKQINKAKMLPENLRFVYNAGRLSGMAPFYEIVPKGDRKSIELKNNGIKINPKGTRELPEGYIVTKNILGTCRAVQIKKT